MRFLSILFAMMVALCAAPHRRSSYRRPLTAEDRSKIQAARSLRGAVLLCESDPGIGAFACTS